MGFHEVSFERGRKRRIKKFYKRTKSVIEGSQMFNSLRGSISYRVGGSACPFVSEPNAPAVHANLPYPQA